MEKIVCLMCEKSDGIYLETIPTPSPNKEYKNTGIFCNCCGKIGESDTKTKIKNIKINTADFIKTNKENIRKKLNDAHADWVENSMGRW